MKGSKDFIVIPPDQIIEIPKSSNLSWLRLFYSLPQVLMEKRPEYLSLPRSIRQVLDSEDSRAMIRSDSFPELVWDCYAGRCTCLCPQQYADCNTDRSGNRESDRYSTIFDGCRPRSGAQCNGSSGLQSSYGRNAHPGHTEKPSKPGCPGVTA